MKEIDEAKIRELNFVKDQFLLEAQFSEILPEECKSDVVKQILAELDHFSAQSWFNCKMILWKNRYDQIDKDSYFKWLNATHLRNLIELQGGIIDEQQT